LVKQIIYNIRKIITSSPAAKSQCCLLLEKIF
jgi:hypothetical protein